MQRINLNFYFNFYILNVCLPQTDFFVYIGFYNSLQYTLFAFSFHQ